MYLTNNQLTKMRESQRLNVRKFFKLIDKHSNLRYYYNHKLI